MKNQGGLVSSTTSAICENSGLQVFLSGQLLFLIENFLNLKRHIHSCFAPGNYVANLYFSGAGISVSAGVGQVDNLTRFCVDFCSIWRII